MTPPSNETLSRRTALAGLGLGTLALALAKPGFALAQDATPSVPLATHPIVGAWHLTNYPGTSDEGKSIGIFAETGLYAELLWDRNVTLGEWRPTDAATVELRTLNQWLIPFDDYFVSAYERVVVPNTLLTPEEGTAVVPVRVELDDSGDSFFRTGMVWLYDETGANDNSFGLWGTGQRMTVAAPTA